METVDLQTPIDYRDLTRFFVPLALQATAQSFSHPLVAMVASRRYGGPLNLAGLAQSGTVMLFPFVLKQSLRLIVNTTQLLGRTCLFLHIHQACDHDSLCLGGSGAMHGFGQVAHGCRAQGQIFNQS